MDKFKPLPPNLKEDLLYIIKQYKDEDNIQNQSDIEKVERLKKRGYCNSFKQYITGAYGVLFNGDDLDYEFNEEQYNLTKTTTQNITNYTNSSIQMFNDISNSVFTAIQNNNEKSVELLRLINNIKSEMSGLSDETKNSITENLDFIEEETTKEKPKKSMIKNTLSVLTAVKYTAEFSAAVTALVSFFSNL